MFYIVSHVQTCLSRALLLYNNRKLPGKLIWYMHPINISGLLPTNIHFYQIPIRLDY